LARNESVFLLPRDKLPNTAEGLAEAIEDALRPFVSRRERMVVVSGTDLRDVALIRVDLSGAVINPNHRPPITKQFESEPAISVRQLAISGDPISILDSQLAFRLEASDVNLNQVRTPDGQVLLVLHSAGSGNIRFAAARAQLEGLIAKAAAHAAQKQGVTVEAVELDLEANSRQTLDVRVTVTARKLFFRAVLRLAGRVAISEDLVARISDLRCEGDGTIAALACATISPYFARIEQRAFPLSALPVGEVGLRDVGFVVDSEQVVITARFGSESKKET
jgi:hypothetical protein